MNLLGATASVLVALVAGGACAVAMLVARRSVWIPAMLVQFICAALLFSSLPAVLVIAYCVAGACACGILAVTSDRTDTSGEGQYPGVPSGMWFRLVAVLLVAFASGALALSLMGAGDGVAAGAPIGAGLLMGLGLLQVGLSEEPLRVGSGLMSIIGGFEVGYTTVESAIALHGLIICVPLLIALVVAYLQVYPSAGRGAAS